MTFEKKLPYYSYAPDPFTPIQLPVSEILPKKHSTHPAKFITKNINDIRLTLEGLMAACDTPPSEALVSSRLSSVLEQLTKLEDAFEVDFYQDDSFLIPYDSHLQLLAYYDSLTNLPNRHYFHQIINKIIEEKTQEDFSFSFLFIDLDGFKLINDKYGHQTGDWLLKQTAQRLKTSLRQTDFIGRYGGDEFTIMAAHKSSETNISRVAERLVNVLSQPFLKDDLSLSVSASIGVSRFPFDGIDYNTLLECADTAMYASKRRGKKCFSHYGAAESSCS